MNGTVTEPQETYKEENNFHS